MEFYKGAFIHYGLGNLFFDQYYLGLPTSQGFLDRHVFYDGRYLGVEPLGILFIDFARPRPMTRQERTVLLRSVFEASGW
jgi:poly-gamma-glutamate synthesis protein (capsule biosynthesis protein)